MGRALRLHLPGSAFHVCSRTQGHADWFVDDIKDAIADILLRGVASAGAAPVAFAVMDTHFHLLLFQGSAPLGYTMQPILRRIALIVQQRHGVEGHVFERRYRAKLCQDADHLPNAILYVHRNPVKASICKNARDYRWSSARYYESGGAPGLLAVNDGLRVFDLSGDASVENARAAYLARLRTTPDEALDGYWDWFWRAGRRRSRNSPQYIPGSPHVERAQLRDIRDVALTILYSIDPEVDIEVVSSRYGGPQIVKIRHELIAALLQRGYAGVKIANYLRVSQALVSRIRSAIRWSSVEDCWIGQN